MGARVELIAGFSSQRFLHLILEALKGEAGKG